MTKDELLTLAAAREISGLSESNTKSEIINAILAAQTYTQENLAEMSESALRGIAEALEISTITEDSTTEEIITSILAAQEG